MFRADVDHRLSCQRTYDNGYTVRSVPETRCGALV